MLQRIQAQVGELGRFRMAKNAADATMIVEMIVFQMNHYFSAALPSRARSIAPAQIDWSDAGLSLIVKVPL